MSANRTALQLHVTEDANRVTVGFPPETALTEGNADELHRELAAAAAGREHPHLVIDLAGVVVLTSVILSKFLAINKQVRAAGGQVALHNPSSDILQVFKVTRLDTVLGVRTDATGLPA
jgi:anti-anti-sigma factor